MITGISVQYIETPRLYKAQYFIKKYPKFLLSYSAFVLLDIFQNPSMYLSRMRNKSIPISIHVITGVTLEPATKERQNTVYLLSLEKFSRTVQHV